MRLPISASLNPYFLACMLLLPLQLSGASFPDSFDGYFRYSSERFLERDWRQLKAQAIQESRIDPLARSPVGAMGIMQFMPGTWAMCSKALNINASPYNPKASILCGGWYMGVLDRNWNRRNRPQGDIWRLSLASYNAGIGNILKAQRACNDGLLWSDIGSCLYLITGYENSYQTTRYVQLVPQWYKQLLIPANP